MRIGMLAGVVVVALSLVLWATLDARAAADPKAPAAGNPDAAAINGQLSKIDGKSLTVSVKEKDGAAKDIVVTVGDRTKLSIREEGKPGKRTEAKFEDLKVGQMLRVYYSKSTAVAGVIIIIAQPAAPASSGAQGSSSAAPAK